ncbi:MAG TPA: hypothetical protein VEY91_00760 [Candidatus Limnocylindria bacterium]|nr:hypothetical protein [Candidatus Limnocylindria bacterium]
MMARLAWVVTIAFVLAGCASMQPVSQGGSSSPLPSGSPPVPAQTPVPVSPPPQPTPVGTTASGGSITSTTPGAVVDSLPSADARRVLATIPEPLRPEERVPAPATSRPQVSTVRPAAPAPPDSIGTAASPDSLPGADDDETVPIPTPTEPLGDRPGSFPRGLPVDTLLAPPPSTPPASAPTPARPTPPPPAAPDSCWRLQLGAPNARAKAEPLLAAAESQLLLPMVIETEKGLFKVRTRDCLASAVADSLRRRALASGFTGAYRIASKRR